MLGWVLVVLQRLDGSLPAPRHFDSANANRNYLLLELYTDGITLLAPVRVLRAVVC